MTDKQWEQFFTLLGEIVDLPLPVDDKVELVRNKAEEHGCEAMDWLEEFAAWDFE